MAALDVLRFGMVLRVVREVVGPHVVGRQLGRAANVRIVQALEELPEVHHVLGRLGERDDLGLAGREGDAILFARTPRQRAGLPHDDPARRG
eukprot:5600049-Prymnesium_polylepis.1